MRLGVAAALVEGTLVAGDVLVESGRVRAVGLGGGNGRGTAVAGFVDWQVNGFGGVHFAAAEPPDYLRAAEALAREGIVWAAPALLGLDEAGCLAALGVLGEVRRGDPRCGFTGAHLEGPFLSELWRGAHDPRWLCDGDPVRVEALLRTGQVAMATVAPERPGVRELIPSLVRSGVLVSLGHTDAPAEQCRQAEELGARGLTHCWNAHRRFAPRDPGPAGWALASPQVTVGLVADGVHVAPETLALTMSAAAGRVALTTDAIAPAGTEMTEWRAPGIGRVGSTTVTVADGAARLADGTLAGSVATPTAMLRVLDAAGVAFGAAVEALSAPQSWALRLGEWHVRPGDPANVVVLDDDHSVLQTWREGERVF
jgi:N-acetylglucosamine-6-phosphate deacetylase